ncbi:histidine kinase N-terminal 7TM domain-containing protein [Cytobacillus sp. FJAT-54145]|uniref:Histidine kinase N-terminal 7TM domain-containing protein n=1 Tax=Cytobacillus spartinae TaxID=3299023 RepID=A0ABW6K6S8_9BACI
MNQEIIGYVFATFLGGILSLILCIYALITIKKTPGGRFYILATFFSSFFTFSYGFELLSKDLEQIKFWLRMEYIALPLIPVFILFMCLSYVGKKINRYLRIFLYVLPITTTLMQITNEYHHLYYSSVSLRGDSLNPIVELEGGLWFIVHSIFLYAIIAASIVVLLLEIKKVTTKFRKQILWMNPHRTEASYIKDTSHNRNDQTQLSS